MAEPMAAAPEERIEVEQIGVASARLKARLKLFRTCVGVREGRSLWGLEPFDFRPWLKTTSKSRRSSVETKEERATEHSTGHSESLWYRCPKRRHDLSEDIDKQYELHVSWGEVFLDLIFVGAAYRLGKVVKFSFCDTSPDDADYRRELAPADAAAADPACLGPTLGILYAAGMFLSCLRLWLCDLHFRGRFDCPSKVHKLHDVLSYLVLVYAGQNIYPVDTYVAELPRLYGFVVSCCIGQALWLLRWLEVALFSHDEQSRRFSSLRLVDDLPAILWWVGALLVAQHRGADDVLVPILMILGAYWSDLRTVFRVQRAACLRMCDPDGELEELPKLRTRVAINVAFAIHRFDEFMMLMIGEGMLQLVIATPKESFDELFHEGWNAATISGFLLSLSMCYSFNVTEPHKSRGHAFARGSRPAAMYCLLLPPKALSILFSGIGIKMILYKPDKPLVEELRIEQQLQLSVSLSACFALQLVRQALHHKDGIIAFYSPSRLRKHWKLTATIVARLLLIGAMIGVSFHKGFQLWQFAIVQACLAVANCLCHVTETHVDPARKHHSVRARFSTAVARVSHFGHHAIMKRNSKSGSRIGGGGASMASPASTSTEASGSASGSASANASASLPPRPSGRGGRRDRKKASCMIRGDSASRFHVKLAKALGSIGSISLDAPPLADSPASTSASPAASASEGPPPRTGPPPKSNSVVKFRPKLTSEELHPATIAEEPLGSSMRSEGGLDSMRSDLGFDEAPDSSRF